MVWSEKQGGRKSPFCLVHPNIVNQHSKIVEKLGFLLYQVHAVLSEVSIGFRRLSVWNRLKIIGSLPVKGTGSGNARGLKRLTDISFLCIKCPLQR